MGTPVEIAMVKAVLIREGHSSIRDKDGPKHGRGPHHLRIPPVPEIEKGFPGPPQVVGGSERAELEEGGGG